MNGYSEYNGRLEMCVNEKWGTICDERFGSEEADATCGALGYKNSGRQPIVCMHMYMWIVLFCSKMLI